MHRNARPPDVNYRQIAALLAVAVGEAVLYEGGFSATARLLFAILAAGAVVAAVLWDRRALTRLVRIPPVVVLLGLGVFGAATSAWTVSSAGTALAWGMTVAAYAGVMLVAAALARVPRVAEVTAAGICGLAIISGLVGLAAAASFGEPFADRVGGVWRPGGTLEYSAALSLLEVSALPALLFAMCRPSRRLAAAGALGGAVAASVLALSGSRAELALGALVCAAAVAFPGRTVRSSRAVAVAAVGVLAATAASAHVFAGGATAAAARSPGHHAPRTHAADFWHGRLHLWHAAIETAADRPLTGSGADAFLAASARHQQSGPVRFAHDLPLELAAELGIAGALLALALYATVAREAWRARHGRAFWLLGPATVAFPVAGLVDWPWHLAGCGAVWAVSLGVLAGGIRASEYGSAPRRRATPEAR